MANVSNATLGSALSGDEPPRDTRAVQVNIAVLSIIFITAGVLNVGLLLVLWTRRKRLSRMSVFVFQLCVADLAVTFFQVCPQLVWEITDRFAGPDVLCRAVKYLQVVGVFASSYMVVVMTHDRESSHLQPHGDAPEEQGALERPRVRRLVRLLRRKPAADLHLLPGRGRSRRVRLLCAVRQAVGTRGLRDLDDSGDIRAAPPRGDRVPAATFTILELLASLNSCTNPCIYLLFSGKMPKTPVALTRVRQPDRKEATQEEATVVGSLS